MRLLDTLRDPARFVDARLAALAAELRNPNRFRLTRPVLLRQVDRLLDERLRVSPPK